MLEIRVIATQPEIRKLTEALSVQYEIHEVSKLYPTSSRNKVRCYIRAVDKRQCKLCGAMAALPDEMLCPACMAAIEKEVKE